MPTSSETAAGPSIHSISSTEPLLSSQPLLVVDSLLCERGDRLLFAGLKFDLVAGDGIRVEGENGAGKTTLLRVIAGLTQQYEGLITWRGLGTRRNRGELHAEMLYLGHLAGVKAVLTPLENLRWWAVVHTPHLKEQSKVQFTHLLLQALDKVGLSRFAHAACHTLSAGQQRRVGLARLYLSRHPLWILDEPFTAIDRNGIEQLEALISDHLAQGGLAIITSHQAMNIEGFDRCILADYKTDYANTLEQTDNSAFEIEAQY